MSVGEDSSFEGDGDEEGSLFEATEGDVTPSPAEASFEGDAPSPSALSVGWAFMVVPL